MRLARVGLESVAGYLGGGMQAWIADDLETGSIPQISVEQLRSRLETEGDLQVVDVRRPAEYESGHVPRALSAPLTPPLAEQLSGLDKEHPVAVICAGGYRSSAATSLLARRGFRHLLNVTGGTGAWIKAGHPVEKQMMNAE